MQLAASQAAAFACTGQVGDAVFTLQQPGVPASVTLSAVAAIEWLSLPSAVNVHTTRGT